MKNITKYTTPKHTWNGYRVIVHSNGFSFRRYVGASKHHGKTAASCMNQALNESVTCLNDLRTILANPRSMRAGSLTKVASNSIIALGFKIIISNK